MMPYKKYQTTLLCVYVVLLSIVGCDNGKNIQTQFVEVHDLAGVEFNNKLSYTEELNPYTFRNFYNGGGVAVGDVNNDGLLDIYFTGNLEDNKLYLNEGNWKFKDITFEAGVGCSGVWSTGATFVDINADGLLDLYVCKSGPPGGENRYNELFVNNGNLTFTESAREYGLDVKGLSVQAAFFDYDKDGDLDCYLLTNSIRSVGNYDLVAGLRNIPDSLGNKFYLNNNGHFEDYSEKSGVYTSSIGFGLGVTLGDFNYDGWQDMFVSNDFFERDYLYLNNKNGGFTEELEHYFSSISMGSMGADVGDLNNDGQIELFVTEMLPDSLNRKKVKAVFENWDKYQLGVSQGYHNQFPRNTLQRGIGDNYLEIGRFSGVSATEWSWSALIFDMDNDGLKDIFISNGINKDLLDRDYLNYMASDDQIRRLIDQKQKVITTLINQMPSQPLPNYMYKNQGGFNFDNVSESHGLAEPSFSNGSAYGDLDNDGDLDLVINNVNQPAFLFKNQLDTATNRSITVKLSSDCSNTYQIGAKVQVFHNGHLYSADNFTARGFQSSTAPIVHIGLGNVRHVDSLHVLWPNMGCKTLYDVPTNKIISLKNDKNPVGCSHQHNKIRQSYLTQVKTEIDFKHQENSFSDFDRERLLVSMTSNLGPHISLVDLNKDGDDEIFIGGAKGQASEYISDNGFALSLNRLLQSYGISEDIDHIFFDADNDGDQDLYIARGGRAFSKSSSALQDELYINSANGFVKGERLPFKSYFSSSSVDNTDFDGDGDQDLFVSEKSHPFIYGLGGRGYLLSNDGDGVFKDVSELLAGIESVGMITDAKWADINADALPDLVVVGEWMGIHVFINVGGKFEDRTEEMGLAATSGLWNTVQVEDVDGNGTLDVIAGNLGLNTFMKRGNRLYIYDFDGNGSTEQILCEEINCNYYPIHDKDELVAQLPGLKKKLLYYSEYSKMTMKEIFGETLIDLAEVYEMDELRSMMYLNDGNRFLAEAFPDEVQYAPVYAIYIEDLNKDGKVDFLVGGNQFNVKPQFGRYDASTGWLCLSDSEINDLSTIPLNIQGQIRDIKKGRIDGKSFYIFARNNDYPVMYRWNEEFN